MLRAVTISFPFRSICFFCNRFVLYLFLAARLKKGMGEPLNNYDAVLASIRGMSDSRMFKLSPRHITLSTVGVVPRMKQLTIDAPETQLALSLHAPNQASFSVANLNLLIVIFFLSFWQFWLLSATKRDGTGCSVSWFFFQRQYSEQCAVT